MTQPSTQPSTNPSLDPTVNPDAQEALSIKYANGAVIVVPLKSGALAIFDRSFQLKEIIDDLSSGLFARYAFAFKAALMTKTAEAKFYGEPDDETYKRDTKAASRLANRPDKTIDTSDFEF